jgi:dihydrofolate reductase
MRNITIMMMVTLDGVVEQPSGEGEDPTQFSLGDWTAPYRSAEGLAALVDEMKEPFDLLLGRNTYNLFSGYWPKQIGPIGDAFNAAKKYVVSDHEIETAWKESALITGDVTAELKKLKNSEGPAIQVHGSALLVQTLLKEDLADELHLRVFPVTLGQGKRLFGEGTIPAAWKLTHSKATDTGVLIANYTRDGALKTK